MYKYKSKHQNHIGHLMLRRNKVWQTNIDWLGAGASQVPGKVPIMKAKTEPPKSANNFCTPYVFQATSCE